MNYFQEINLITANTAEQYERESLRRDRRLAEIRESRFPLQKRKGKRRERKTTSRRAAGVSEIV
jgi:hypothetical protein